MGVDGYNRQKMPYLPSTPCTIHPPMFYLSETQKLMNRFNELLSYFNEPLSQTQREAVVEILLWTMYVDKSVHYRESDQIDEIALELSEDIDLSLQSHIRSSLPKVREIAFDQSKWDNYLATLSTALETEGVRRSAYHLCLDVAESDKDMVAAEEHFLDKVQKAFEL
jgi:hypothetical protein